MAAPTNTGPDNRTPDYAQGEFDYAFLKGAATYDVDRGAGSLHACIVGVVGTLVKFYDIAPGGTPSDANQIATVSLAALSTGPILFDAGFALGLTAVVTGAAELTVTGRFALAAGPKRVIRR